MRIGVVNVFEDNEGAIKLATNKHASRRTKQNYETPSSEGRV